MHSRLSLPTVPAAARRHLATAISSSGHRAEVLATDSEQDRSAVEEPAEALSSSLPTNKPGLNFSEPPSAPSRASSNVGVSTSRLGETTQQQQQQAREAAAPSSPAVGHTVADSRLSVDGQASAQSVSAAMNPGMHVISAQL